MHGVLLDPNSYAARDARQRGVFAGDELYFDGYDIGQDRQRRRQVYDNGYGDEYDSGEEMYANGGSPYQLAVREKEELLIQSALERIARARAKGKTNVNLSQEEMEALERRRGQPPEPSTALVSPPATPAKASKSKNGSRTNSSTNLANQKKGKKGSLQSPSPAKSNSKAKVDRKPSAEQALPYPVGSGPPGIMVPGPNGVPVFAPIVNYAPPSPEATRTNFPNGRTRSRSTSKHSMHSQRDATPPERTDPYAQYPVRYYPSPAARRPDSSSSMRSLPDDIDWYPPPTPRNRSASNAQYAGYPDYDGQQPLPAAQGGGGRRNVSGPPDVRYASLRRMPPSSSPLAARPAGVQHANSDPTIASGRKSSSLGQELERSSSSDSSEDQGVQVNIVPDGSAGGYEIQRAPVVASGNEGRRRKGKRG